MVHTCVVHGCRNRSDDPEKRKFFTIPAVRTTEGERTKELSEQRRMLWIARIYRKDFQPSKYSKVCSDHFISGERADLYDFANPDWAPSFNMNTKDQQCPEGRMERHERLKKRLESKKLQEAATSASIIEHPEYAQPRSNPVCAFIFKGRLENETSGTECTLKNSNDRQDFLMKIKEECKQLICENSSLKLQINSVRTFNVDTFSGDDRKVSYYTGLPSFITLMALFNFIEPYIPDSPRISVTKFQKFILVLIRLRLNAPVQDLAYRFQIGTSTVSRIFLTTLHVLYVQLKDFIYWPTREELRKTMPMEFRKYFGLKVAVVIDCFEIFIERPSNLLARAATWSSYKHHNTVKYLIGITPQGCISFISEAWGGRTSDKHITDHSGFLNKLLPGDIVLADRGFDIHESVGLVCAEVKIPNFTKGKTQLSAREIENTRKIAHVRIHVERVIGLLRNKYMIVTDTMPVDFLVTSEENQVPVVDKIVTVCCGLTNLCQSVIPFN
ncbi:uncharacterized protein LOC134254688 [Saccostrea cucullata]|uniref:uncharacterized protein LOC134254688 n=1 Tax=Saccostrea cuccullata TaxID=36930 RepID=UPI002ED17C83